MSTKSPELPAPWHRWREIAAVSSLMIVPADLCFSLILRQTGGFQNVFPRPGPWRVLGLAAPGFSLWLIIVILGAIWVHGRGLRLFGSNWWDVFRSTRDEDLVFGLAHRRYVWGGLIGGGIAGLLWGFWHPHHDRLLLVNATYLLFFTVLGMLPGLGMGMLFDPIYRAGAVIGVVESIATCVVLGMVVGLPGEAWTQFLFMAAVWGSLMGVAMVPLVQVLWDFRDPITNKDLSPYLSKS